MSKKGGILLQSIHLTLVFSGCPKSLINFVGKTVTMKFLLETVLSVSGLVIFLALAFFAPSFFWVGLAILLILGAIAFILGYFGRTKNAEETLEEVMTTLEGAEKEK